MAELIKKQILEKQDDPEMLEALYRSDPDNFKEILLSLSKEQTGSTMLDFWRARLEYKSRPLLKPAISPIVVFFIALFFGLIIRIPAAFLTEEWYLPRFAPFFTLLSVSTYFLVKKQNRTLAISLVVFSVLTSIYLFLLPDIDSSDSVTMALIHLPLTALAILGATFVQDAWRESRQRIAFIKFCGELLVLTTLLLIGGGVLSFFIMGLFELMEINIHFEEWYMRNVGIFGIVSAPLVAAYVYDSILKRKLFIMELLAKIFAPLFCIFIFSYLGVMMFMGNNPFVNRDFLVVFNGLLILILGIVIFSVVSRDWKAKINIFDYVNVLLVSATILINLLALSAIIFRLYEYGMTPNRFCVLGVNWIVFIHLILIAVTYFKVLTRRSDFNLLREKVVGYFPVYCSWFLFVTFFIPLIFGFV